MEIAFFRVAVIITHGETDKGIVRSVISRDLIGIELIFRLSLLKGHTSVDMPISEILAGSDANISETVLRISLPAQHVFPRGRMERTVVEEVLLRRFIPENDVIGIKGSLHVENVLLLEIISVFACVVDQLRAAVTAQIDFGKRLELFFLGAIGVGVIEYRKIIEEFFSCEHDIVIFRSVIFVFSDIRLAERNAAVTALCHADHRLARNGRFVETMAGSVRAIIDAVRVTDLHNAGIAVMYALPFVIAGERDIFLFRLVHLDLYIFAFFNKLIVPAQNSVRRFGHDCFLPVIFLFYGQNRIFATVD